MAKVTVIKATSRASIKVGDSFYTVEFGEEKSIQDKDDIEAEKAILWEECNGEVDRQIEEIMQMFKSRKSH